MRYTTYSYRIKDATTGKHLDKMARSVNYVWNYCNEVNQERWAKFRKTYTAFDLCKLTAGCSVLLDVDAQTINEVCRVFDESRKKGKRIRLRWRNSKRSLGWIPFRGASIKMDSDFLRYRKKHFGLWLSRPVEGVIKSGAFNQDSRGRWYVNLIIQDCDRGRTKTGFEVGVDLGLKTIATLSDGTQLGRENLTQRHEQKLSTAQRARKKKRATAIHAKIKNARKDWNHKASTRLVRNYDRIIVGNISSSKLKKTRLAKSVSDASWSAFKTMLARKAVALGVEVKEVNESFSTVTCSTCSERSGPSGLGALGVREWVCSHCGSVHDRDVNAAKNILRVSLSGMTGQLRESPRE